MYYLTMKQAFSILVLCVLLAHVAGFYIYFFIQLNQIQKEMSAEVKKLPMEKLELIKLTSAEFEKAHVEDHEIKVNEKMYDIARIEKEGDFYFVYCLHDKAEDNLLTFLDKILNLPLKDKKVPSQVLKFTSLTFILPSVGNMPQYETILLTSFTPYSEGTTLFVLSLDSPPPKV